MITDLDMFKIYHGSLNLMQVETKDIMFCIVKECDGECCCLVVSASDYICAASWKKPTICMGKNKDADQL